MDFWDICYSVLEKNSKSLSDSYKRMGNNRDLSDAQRQKAKELSLEYKDKAREIRERREEYRKNK